MVNADRDRSERPDDRWGEVKALAEQVAETRRRAEAAERALADERAKVARVEALLPCANDDCDCGGDRASVTTREIRAALAGPEPGPCRQCHARHAIETGEDGYACCLACSESSGGTHFKKPGTSDG